MASPFRAFRKYQKTLLALAGVVLIFVFVLGDPLSSYLRSQSGGAIPAGQRPDDIAVEWNGGKLTNSELGQLVMQRMLVNNFIRQIAGLGQMAAEQSGGEPQPLRVEPIIGPERTQEGVESDVVHKRIIADIAREAGMAVSDDHLVSYLTELGRGFVSVDQIRQILSSMSVGGRRASQDFVLDALREEMLARNYMAGYRFAFLTNLPEQGWRDWLKVNDRVVVEAAAIPAESLLVDVPEPTEAELEAFFNEYKEAEPQPVLEMNTELPSPNPGFRVPRKVAVQYLLADFNQFLTKVEDEVTDAEIEKFYEDNKDPHFIRAESVLSDSAEEATEPAVGEDAGETSRDGASDGEDAADAKAAPATNDGSASERLNPFRLTAFAEDTPADSDSEPTTGDSAATPEAATDTPAVDAPTAELAEPAEAPKQFQPIEDVRDEIRRDIAQAKVAEQLETLMSTLERELDTSYTEYFGASLDAEAAGKEIPPAPPALADLTPIAESNEVVYQKTEPATWQQLRETPIGKSSRPEWRGVPFYLAIFSSEHEHYQPISTQDLDANRYLAMKTADIPGKVPTLAEVREEVVRAWKLRKAGELALKRAEELAKQAQSTGASLEDAFANDKAVKVVKTDPFAYLTVGSVSRDGRQVESFRLGEPEEIAAAGPEFMEEVFTLKDGEVGATPNHDHSIAYVVRIAEHQNTPAELRQAFLFEADTWDGLTAMATQRYQQERGTWVADLLESADVHWERPADELFREDAETASDET